MKLKGLKIKNMHNIQEMDIEFNSGVTRLRGVNGAGKSSILNAIWAAFKGIAEKGGKGQLIGERYRFIGTNDKSLDLEVKLIDEELNAEISVKNKITKSNNQISFHAPSSYQVSAEWLNDLMSASFMSAKNFCLLPGTQQAIELGIDVLSYDQSIDKEKTEISALNRELKNIKRLDKIDKVDKVSVSDLIAEKQRIESENEEKNNQLDEIKRLKNEVKSAAITLTEKKGDKSLVEDILSCIGNYVEENGESELSDKYKEKLSSTLEDVEAEIGSYNKIIQVTNKSLSEINEPDPVVDTSDIDQKIIDSEKTNLLADQYEKYTEAETAYENKLKEVNEAKKRKANVEKNRFTYIKSFDFGFDGLNVDEKGHLTLNDGNSPRPIKEPYFSRAQLELIVARLHTSVNPELKVRWIDDFNLLDEVNQAKIIDELLEAGFQIITAEVGNKKESSEENVILIKDCKVVDSYSSDNPKKSLV